MLVKEKINQILVKEEMDQIRVKEKMDQEITLCVM